MRDPAGRAVDRLVAHLAGRAAKEREPRIAPPGEGASRAEWDAAWNAVDRHTQRVLRERHGIDLPMPWLGDEDAPASAGETPDE